MSKYDPLREYLKRQGDRVTVDFATIDNLVGGLPDSARKHSAWWNNGDASHSHCKSWGNAGFRAQPHLSQERVVFFRFGTRPITTIPSLVAPESSGPDLVLVSCVKSKQLRAAAAKDLYTSPPFRGARAAAERAGVPWFILSAEHGLVEPDQWLSPYDRRLSDQTSAYRGAWGAWVLARLETLVGGLSGKTIEIHAGSAYVEPIRRGLEQAGAKFVQPLGGMTMGQRLAHYAETRTPTSARADGGVEALLARLTDASQCVAVRDIAALRTSIKGHPGLYSWWVDAGGAHDLSEGLGHEIMPGLIYAGQAGASTKGDLWGRLTAMHLGEKSKMSTFRLTLGSILARPLGWTGPDDPRLSSWMELHLSVIAVPIDARPTISGTEREILLSIDPALNIKDVPSTDRRARLKALRREARRSAMPENLGNM